MDKITHEMRESQWSQIIQECLASGMKKTTWCRENNVSSKQFFYWQRKLREKAYQQQSALPVAVDVHDSLPLEKNTVFAEIPVTFEKEIPSVDTTAFRPDVVIHSGTTVIEISNTVSPALLAALGGILHAE